MKLLNYVKQLIDVIQFTLQNKLSTMNKMSIGAIVVRGDSGQATDSDSEEADNWMMKEILRRDNCHPW